ncbi:MAG: inositol-3-phosphate synthase [Planctomycetes bacterium]|nr:inositol-3-phosphate synthase [Planctomycetota bacterium]
MSPDPSRTGLLLVGARGAIATTVLHGLESIRAGLPACGLVTETPAFSHIDWEDLARFHVTGWDIGGDSHRSAEDLARVGVLPQDLVELCAGLRERFEHSIAPGLAEPEDAQLMQGESADRLLLSLPEAVEALREDIRNWRKSEGYRRSVVVYLATAERDRELPAGWSHPEADPMELLSEAPRDLSRSVLYAIASILEGVPFINFTPAPGGAVPAVAGLAHRLGVPVLGNDGKTGETLIKTVLAPMFRDRGLNVMAWEGYNMLGNKDGAALSDPMRASGKLRNKDAVLHDILDSERVHTGVRIDFVPSLHDLKTAMDFVHFEGFLGSHMQLQFTWQASDSALAAPLVLDLARIALRAQERGEGGPLRAAASFFKNPLDVCDHDFHRQMDLLRTWVAHEEG